MAFIKKPTIKIGIHCKLTREIEVFGGKFEVGTVVTVTNINERGYCIVDGFGNAAVEIGFDCLEMI